MVKLFLTAVGFFAFAQIGLGQSQVIFDINNKESYSELNDGIIKKEMASFILSLDDDTFQKLKMEEIPVESFATQFAVFSKGKLIIKIMAAPFDTAGHKFGFGNDKKHPYILIDGKPFW